MLGGLAGLVLGADLFVDAAVALAEAAGVPQAVVGLTIVAVGTSLPEL
ncbi:MAG: sodium:calcium antiporter, partial [Bacteroidota bacterium]